MRLLASRIMPGAGFAVSRSRRCECCRSASQPSQRAHGLGQGAGTRRPPCRPASPSRAGSARTWSRGSATTSVTFASTTDAAAAASADALNANAYTMGPTSWSVRPAPRPRPAACPTSGRTSSHTSCSSGHRGRRTAWPTTAEQRPSPRPRAWRRRSCRASRSGRSGRERQARSSASRKERRASPIARLRERAGDTDRIDDAYAAGSLDQQRWRAELVVCRARVGGWRS